MNAPFNALGACYSMSFAEYLASPAMSNSGLKLHRKSAAHWMAGRDPAEKPSDSLRRGTLLHTMALEIEHLGARYIVKPEGMNFATKEGKAWRDAVPSGVEIVNADEYRAATRQSTNLRALPEVGALLSNGHAEVSFFWIDDATGIPCKGRADWVYRSPAGVVLLDLKTCEDASPEGFSRACARYGYHMQAAWYSDGWRAATGENVLGFVFGAVESGWPHIASAYMLSDEDTEKGRAECRRLLAQHAECLRTDTWPGYVSTVTTITLPAWA